MLGLFDLNMLLLYEECLKAFTNPQKEILKASSATLRWTWNSEGSGTWMGMFAPSLSVFSGSGNYVPSIKIDVAPNPYSVINTGLSNSLLVIYTSQYAFVALNAGPKQLMWTEKAHIAPGRPWVGGAQRPISRKKNPQSPMILCRPKLWRLGGQCIFVLTRPALIPASITLQTSPFRRGSQLSSNRVRSRLV